MASVSNSFSYYTFGMMLPARKFTSENYRYGFNGKENDDDVKGSGNQQDYGMRIYDNRLGRFLSVDPLTKDFPWNTPYAFAENDVIRSIDLEGLEKVQTTFRFQNPNSQVNLIDAEIILLDANAPREEVFKFELNDKIYSANSYYTLKGRDNGNDNIGDFTGVTSLDNTDLVYLIGYASYIIYDVYKGSVEGTTSRESNAYYGSGNMLDFKTKAYDLLGIGRNQLIEIDGVTYNANEAGNFLWGMALEYHGSFISPNRIAEAGSNIQGRSDELNEQKAISEGRIKALKLLRTKGVEDEVLGKRLEHRANAKENEDE